MTKADFHSVATLLTWDLRKAFPDLDVLDIAAIGGNGAHESDGFKTLQEIKPVVAGSRGGYGYFQWTGVRRRAFEAWAHKRGLPPDSYEANAGFLIYELRTSEKAALPRLRRAQGLEGKVKAFELGYERAGVKHYDSRLRWARKFLAEMPNADSEEPDAEALKLPPKPLAKSKTVWSEVGKVSTAASGIGAVIAGVDWKTVLAIGVIAFMGFVGWTIYERMQKD